jgi:hypothetical protein
MKTDWGLVLGGVLCGALWLGAVAGLWWLAGVVNEAAAAWTVAGVLVAWVVAGCVGDGWRRVQEQDRLRFWWLDGR